MNVMKFSLFILIFFGVVLSANASFNVCNVNLNEPWFEINGSDGNSVLIIDDSGNMYARGTDRFLFNKNSLESFEVGSAFFNRVTSSYSSLSQLVSSFPAENGLIVRNNAGVDVGKITDSGQIHIVGFGAVQGQQAACPDDGWLYCNGGTRENRDYFCDITGDRSGNCEYSVLSSENCLTKATEDTDGGINYYTRGTVTDYIGCSGGSCTYNQYTDVCTSSTDLREYYPVGSSHSSQIYDCRNENYYYCSGLTRYQAQFSCSGGACYLSNNQPIQTCSSSPTQTSYSCSSSTTRAITTTTYSPQCSPSGCSQTSSTSTSYQTCPSGQECTGGTCVASCVPQTCSSLGYNCGTHNNGCGGTISCGTCPSGQNCGAGVCSPIPFSGQAIYVVDSINSFLAVTAVAECPSNWKMAACYTKYGDGGTGSWSINTGLSGSFSCTLYKGATPRSAQRVTARAVCVNTNPDVTQATSISDSSTPGWAIAQCPSSDWKMAACYTRVDSSESFSINSDLSNSFSCERYEGPNPRGGHRTARASAFCIR